MEKPVRLKFTIGGTSYHALMQAHPLTEQIAAMCPFEADFSRSGNVEYYAPLPRKASPCGCAETSTAHKNHIAYFAGWNALSLVLEDCNIAPYTIAPLGEFEEDVAVVLRNAGSKIHIRCEAE